MSFINYLFLGVVAYGMGWALRIYVLDKKAQPSPPYSLTHPVIIRYLMAFFAVMLIVSFLIGHFILGHTQMDIAFILVNSAVATFVFSFGLSPDQTKHNLPD